MRSPASVRSAAGFTLVEALVATALFSLVMLGTIPMFIRSISGVARNRTLMNINGGTQALIDELTVRYGIDRNDPLVAMNVWRVYNNSVAQPNGAAPVAVQRLFLNAPGTALNTQTRMVGQVQYTVVTLPSTRVQATVELYYFTLPSSIIPMAGSAQLIAVPPHMAEVRQIAYIDQP